MSSRGRITQVSGKRTNRFLVDSQTYLDHQSNLTHMHHLEDFTNKSTIQAKKYCDQCSNNSGNIIRKHRADNECFSDSSFYGKF